MSEKVHFQFAAQRRRLVGKDVKLVMRGTGKEIWGTVLEVAGRNFLIDVGGHHDWFFVGAIAAVESTPSQTERNEG